MRKLFTLTTCWLLAATYSYSQVKDNYEYSTTMPYGTLDIRTRISSSEYYYLNENKTYSFRESSPGVRTSTYLDMTGWDSSPYKEGHLRHKDGTADDFVMNYRLLFPDGYKSTYSEGYPMIVHLHGAYERANCLYDKCYHSDWDYTVQENSPPAPTSPTHKLLNNDDNLDVGGKYFLGARNLAGTRLPDDPSMPERAFPGFVLAPQMMNSWDSLQVEDVARIVRLLAAKYNIDEDRIYVQGLSIGGYGVYEAMKRASWLFAAALPMAAVWDANIFVQNQEEKVAHMPIWIFQGGEDPRPTPAFTEAIISKLEKAGAVVRYSLYSDLGHTVWWRAYSQRDFYTWMLKQSKANLHAFAGNTVIDKSKSLYPKLMLAEGFLAYEWEKDGEILGRTANTLTVTTPGRYRARFSRKSTSPTEAQWNEWSPYVTITETGIAPTPVVSVNITSPDDGQTFTAPASINFAATASDSDGSISKVEFYNGTTKLGQDASSPYSFTWSSVPAGNYSLIAKAIDNAGNSATDRVEIIVNSGSDGSNNPPAVNVTSPDDDQSFTAPASINFAATASDSDGSISKVEFYNGTTKLGQDATSPYSFTWSNVPAGNYSLIAKAIDDSGNSATDRVAITVSSGSDGSGVSCESTGSIQVETWTGISGKDISSIPVNSSPSSVSNLTIFETPAKIGDNYGSRVRGYVCAPTTGNYTFWIASDDTGELWLSTDESPGNKVRIAHVSGWTYSRQWDKYSTQRSGSISLVGGRKYYIEALLKEASGGDHLAVGWQLPGGALERPIGGNRLIPFGSSPPTNTDPVDPSPSTGAIEAEVWTGISGKDISSIPLNSPPDAVSELTMFETAKSIGDNYGSRVRGYLHVPTTGNYTFWIASDDTGELWLSTDENPGNRERIAYVSGWTYARQWDKFTTQRSASISLVGGRRYYIEALLKEASGGDHLAVGWQLPGGQLERPIPGSRLSKFETGSGTMAARQRETTQDATLYSEINIYPNPAESTKTRLSVGGYEGVTETVQTEIQIINMTGEVVFTERIQCGGNCSDYLINIDKQLVPGVYLVNMKTNGVRRWERLLVK
jgi:dienelactone hydrolase